MRDFQRENLVSDPIHGYVAFTSNVGLPPGEVSERQIIDHPWVQRLRHIRQVQTAWWVFPSAEHSRFQHVLGVMHLASRAVAALYESLREACPDAPSRGYVESLLRMAGLLHDVGHGPFGHFFDEQFLRDYGLTHEALGARIITYELGDLLRAIRRNPNSELAPQEALDPAQIAWLIQRPKAGGEADQPRWLAFLRSLLCGVYTIDNLDFVFRDAYMSGYSQEPYDLNRLLHYTFFSHRGLTLHDRGLEALVRFLGARAELFRTVYFHRTVRAIDLMLEDLFAHSKPYLLPGNPAEHLDAYLDFTESSLLVDVVRWRTSDDPKKQELGEQWRRLLHRDVSWKMIYQRQLIYSEGDSEQMSIFSDRTLVEHKLRQTLPAELRQLPLRVDIARSIHRPHTGGPAAGQNFLFDSSNGNVCPLVTHALYRRLPVSYRICRVYAESSDAAETIREAMNQLFGGATADDVTNM
jgi:HD superfamily phosphohydrolase